MRRPGSPTCWPAAALALAMIAGCESDATPDYESPVSADRIAAIRTSGGDADAAEVRNLIRLLESDDPAVRFFAIGLLERETGRTLGFEHAAPAAERRIAVERWASWYDEKMGRDESASSDTPRETAE